MKNINCRRCLFICAILFLISASALSQKAEESRDPSKPSVYIAHYVDPDIIDSEWNHHLAGYALIASAILYTVGLSVFQLSWTRSSWIILLVAAAIFLAVWSDKEIWPRGSLNWMWLIHHDAEARQHKVYAILLFAIAFVEYFRQSGKLSRVWATWSFPALALLGALLLLIHNHDGHSGLPAGWDDVEKRSQILKSGGLGAIPDVVQSNIAPMHEGHTGAPQLNQSVPMSMSMPQSLYGAAASMQMGSTDGSEHHHHGGAISAKTHVEVQHLWFALVGIALAVFKWVDDGDFWPSKFTTYLWPSAMLVLGVLLVLYTEVK